MSAWSNAGTRRHDGAGAVFFAEAVAESAAATGAARRRRAGAARQPRWCAPAATKANTRAKAPSPGWPDNRGAPQTMLDFRSGTRQQSRHVRSDEVDLGGRYRGDGGIPGRAVILPRRSRAHLAPSFSRILSLAARSSAAFRSCPAWRDRRRGQEANRPSRHGRVRPPSSGRCGRDCRSRRWRRRREQELDDILAARAPTPSSCLPPTSARSDRCRRTPGIDAGIEQAAHDGANPRPAA